MLLLLFISYGSLSLYVSSKLCFSLLANPEQSSHGNPDSAFRSASEGREKELVSLGCQKEAAERDLMPLILRKICTDRLCRLSSLSKLNLSTKSLGFDLHYRSVKFPTKPLAFCRGELAEQHLGEHCVLFLRLFLLAAQSTGKTRGCVLQGCRANPGVPCWQEQRATRACCGIVSGGHRQAQPSSPLQEATLWAVKEGRVHLVLPRYLL